MDYCKKCGTPVNDGVKFCPTCGEAVGASARPAETQSEQRQSYEEPKQGYSEQNRGYEERNQGYSEQRQSYNARPAQNANGESNEKMMGVFAYCSWLVLVPIFAAKNSQFVRFHANQGLGLAIVWTIWWIIEAIVNNIIWAATISTWNWGSWGAASTATMLLGLVNILFAILAILGIVNVVNGRMKEIPLTGKIRILK